MDNWLISHFSFWWIFRFRTLQVAPCLQFMNALFFFDNCRWHNHSRGAGGFIRHDKSVLSLQAAKILKGSGASTTDRQNLPGVGSVCEGSGNILLAGYPGFRWFSQNCIPQHRQICLRQVPMHCKCWTKCLGKYMHITFSIPVYFKVCKIAYEFLQACYSHLTPFVKWHAGTLKIAILLWWYVSTFTTL